MKLIATLIDYTTGDHVVLNQGYLGTQTGKGDYAAYRGTLDDCDHIIAHTGDKLGAREAVELFPKYIQNEEDYRR